MRGWGGARRAGCPGSERRVWRASSRLVPRLLRGGGSLLERCRHGSQGDCGSTERGGERARAASLLGGSSGRVDAGGDGLVDGAVLSPVRAHGPAPRDTRAVAAGGRGGGSHARWRLCCRSLGRARSVGRRRGRITSCGDGVPPRQRSTCASARTARGAGSCEAAGRGQGVGHIRASAATCLPAGIEQGEARRRRARAHVRAGQRGGHG